MSLFRLYILKKIATFIVEKNAHGTLQNMIFMDLDFGTILACAITVCGSIGGSWVAMNNRLYTVEKNIELLRLDLENYKKSNDKRSDDLEKSLDAITGMFKEVMDSIRDINFKLKLKQDRKFKEEQ